jgi:dienelactone hydrolase
MLRRWTLAILLTTCVAMLAGCSSARNASASADRTSLALQFVQSMVDGKFADATTHFDSVVSQAMSAERLKQTWATLIGQCGAFKKMGDARAIHENGFDGAVVPCEFEKTTIDVKLFFDKDGKIGGLWFVPHVAAADTQYSPPDYAKKADFDETEVTVGSGEWKLPGTLSVPKGNGPFPAIVLVHGSGPEDRDETIGPNKPFKDLAWGLASRGVAVLRYEKRSKVYGPKMAKMAEAGKMNSFTVKDETIDDALAAVEVLRQSQRIDQRRIFVLGHSLGGILIPRIGKADPKIAGLIMMAGCGTQPLEDVILRQLTYIASLSGPITDDTRKEIDKKAQSIMKGLPASYTRDLRDYIPSAAEMAKSLKQPMLVLHGARDYQATTADFNIWKGVLSSRTNVTFKLYPNLNHLFMPGTGKSTPEEYNKRVPVSEEAINDIAKWIKAR